MAKRRPTVAAGAVIARSLFLAKLRRMQQRPQVRGLDPLAGYIAAIYQLREWLAKQPQRTRRKGGIGR